MGAQLAVDRWPSVGASGVAFALFGLMLGARQRIPTFAELLTPRIVLFVIGLMFLTIFLSYANLVPVGDAAHVSGFLFGLAVANTFIERRRWWAGVIGLVLLAAITASAVFWLPWSPSWQSWRLQRQVDWGNYQVAFEFIEPRVAKEQPAALNSLAWVLATAPDAQWRDGPRAVELARKACEITEWKLPAIIDTLAAALAECERWQEAEAMERRALEEMGNLDARWPGYYETRAIFLDNLKKIQKREKIRDIPKSSP